MTVNGKKISVDTAPLQWDKYGTYEFAETYVKAIQNAKVSVDLSLTARAFC